MRVNIRGGGHHQGRVVQLRAAAVGEGVRGPAQVGGHAAAGAGRRLRDLRGCEISGSIFFRHQS